jgi:plasmid maintenance system antidote protein VapI
VADGMEILDPGKYFGMTPQFWMNLQTDYDLRRAAVTAPLSKIKPRSAA